MTCRATGKVWRIHVESHERDTSLELTLEYLPDMAPKHDSTLQRANVAIQAEKPSNVSAVTLPS